MQEVAKSLCNMYNHCIPPPPKRIAMIHVGMIQLVDRDDKPFMGYESFVEGDYHKWNTNSGWTDHEEIRHTPQAFTFGSFRLTKGELMVVDVQGVGDLYTDPQIHSLNNEEFGDGNLGARGMALFLKSFQHDTNPVAQYMQFPPFALAPGEQPPPSELEKKKFQEGHDYLHSCEWKTRIAKDQASFQEHEVSVTSPRDVQDKILKEHHINETDGQIEKNSQPLDLSHLVLTDIKADTWEWNHLPLYLISVANKHAPLTFPEDGEVEVPKTVTGEGLAHEALAKLYTDEDERVMNVDGLDGKKMATFHLWMAAVAGCVHSMTDCANHDDIKAADGVAWLKAAASRGGREACVKMVANSDTNESKIEYLLLALSADDGKDDAQRKMDFETCDYELNAQLGECYRAVNDADNASAAYMEAAEGAMGLGMFKLYTKYSMEAES
jgi:hypothetical protein